MPAPAGATLSTRVAATSRVILPREAQDAPPQRHYTAEHNASGSQRRASSTRLATDDPLHRLRPSGLGRPPAAAVGTDVRRTVRTHVSPKPVVLIAEELSPATVDALGPDFEIRHCNGADRAELLPAIADVDAVLVRCATKVDAEAIAAAKKLKVVARAGVGLDNVDVSAATKAGVMVVNAPTSNIVTAAELACGLLIATARNIPQANSALKNGEWKRSKYTGVELGEKTLGVVGLGRIGALVAQRMSAFGMKVVAYDPYVQPARAAQMGVKLLTLDELLEVSDFITVHLPKTPETRRPHRRRGAAQGQAVGPRSSTPRAAGSSTRRRWPRRSRRAGSPARASTCTRRSPAPTPRSSSSTRSWPPRTWARPRTRRRRRPVSPSPSSVRLALAGELVPDAVNVQGGVIAEDVKPGLPLAEKLGRIFTALAGEVAVRLDVEVYGEITQHDVKVLELSALKGVFEDVVDETVSLRQRPAVRAGARRRGAADHQLASRPTTATWSPCAAPSADGEEVSVSGTLAGPKHLQKIVAVGDYDVDLALADHMAFLRYERPPRCRRHRRPDPRRGRASTSPACRSPAPRRAARRWRSLTVDDTVPAGRAHRDRRGDRRHVGALGEPGATDRLWGLPPPAPASALKGPRPFNRRTGRDCLGRSRVMPDGLEFAGRAEKVAVGQEHEQTSGRAGILGRR